MATSGTTAFAPDIAVFLEEAASRAGVEVRSGFDYESAIRSMNFLLLELANRGLNLFAIDQGTIAITAGAGQYDLPADTVDLINVMLRSGTSDFYLDRMGVGSWAQITNKSQQGRPIQFWAERLVAQPRINLWPVPNIDYTLVYWRLRRLQDAGTAANTPDLPFRFWPAFVAGLAYHLASKKDPPDFNRVTMLKDTYEELLIRAQLEDRGRESFFVGIWTK